MRLICHALPTSNATYIGAALPGATTRPLGVLVVLGVLTWIAAGLALIIWENCPHWWMEDRGQATAGRQGDAQSWPQLPLVPWQTSSCSASQAAIRLLKLLQPNVSGGRCAWTGDTSTRAGGDEHSGVTIQRDVQPALVAWSLDTC